MSKIFTFIFYISSIALSQIAFSSSIANITSKSHLKREISTANIDSALTQEESKAITYLYDNYIQNKFFYRELSDAEITLNINILSKNIEFLEEKLSRINSSDESPLIVGVLISLSFSIWWAISASQELHQAYTQFTLKKFKDIYFSEDIIEKLASIKINRKEKKYLDTFSFENIHCSYTTHDYLSIQQKWDQQETIKNKIANLSPAEKEKIKYTALRSTITGFKWAIPLSAIIGFSPLLMSLFASILCFREFIGEINTQIEFDANKRLYKLLKKEHEYRNLVRK